jgi:hypothetical protein
MIKKSLLGLGLIGLTALTSCGFGRYDYINTAISLSSSQETSASQASETVTSQELSEVSLSETGLSDAKLGYSGRHVYDSSVKAMMLYHTASGVEFSFKGTEAKIDFYYGVTSASATSGKDIYYSAILDYQDDLTAPTFAINATTASYALSGLSNQKHHLKIAKRSEPQDGLTGITKVTVKGAFETNEASYNYKFECIGGSGISGHGSLGNPGEARTTLNSSSLHSFGYLTSYLFSGQTSFVANSGWGLKWGYNATNNNGTVNIQTAYESAGIKDDETLVQGAYAHASFDPDFILVNIGGNDYTDYINQISNSAQQAEAIQIFKDNVQTFVTRLHTLHPHAYIIWTSTNESSGNGLAAKSVIDALDPTNSYVKTLVIYAKGSDGDLEGADSHASFATHKKSATVIANYLTSLKSIKTVKSFS